MEAQDKIKVTPGNSIAEVMPKGLTKAEKAAFRRVCDMRSTAGDPVSAIEADTIVDYVQTRARLVIWQKMLKQGQQLDEWRKPRLHLVEQLPLASAIDRTAAACRRLAKDLRLATRRP